MIERYWTRRSVRFYYLSIPFTDSEVMFEELKKPVKDKDRLKSKAYATIMTNFGGLNLELHGDRAPKTVYNFIMLAKQGYYDETKFHRLIPGFMVWISNCH